MNRLRRRLVARAVNDDGFTLIEVVVAMVIFTIISTGVLYTMMTLLSITRDSRSRQVAANLAAEEIDLARDINDVFDITFKQRDRTLNGDTYHVERTSAWVYSSGVTAACGAGTGALRYKFVQIEVTWTGMRSPDNPIRSETLINPNERINDPDLGTLIVSVRTASGAGVGNVPVKATPAAGSVLSAVTDSDGCAFLLGVNPGAYTVSISSPSGGTYVDVQENPTPTQPATVVKASSVSTIFTYDIAGTLRATFLSAGTTIPLNMPASLLSTRDPNVKTSSSASNPRTIGVFPWTDGSSVVAGDAKNCFAADPGLWSAYGTLADGDRPEAVAVESGGTENAAVPMIPITVTGMATSGNGRYLVARSQSAAGNGQPTCATTQVYRFAPATATTMNIALPYGTWILYKGNDASFNPPGTGTKLTTQVTVGAGGTNASGTITLDPRGPQ